MILVEWGLPATIGASEGALWTFLAIGILFTGVAALACYFPARTATRVDPVRSIQVE